jgi:2-keto-3-deoxy-galactonokinase
MDLCGSSCQLLRHGFEVHGVGCFTVKRRMRASRVVEAEEASQRLSCVAGDVVGVEIVTEQTASSLGISVIDAVLSREWKK